MPQQQEKKPPTKKVSTGPSAGLLQRIFGSTPMTPEMEEGINIARREIPGMAPVQSYGLLSRLMQPQAMGYTSPGQTIYLNPRTMQGQSPQEVADTLLHEQTHVEQMKRRGHGPVREFMHEAFGGSREPYHRRPDEIEAFQAERQRRARMNRMQTATPSFTTGEMYVPQDIHLRKEKGIKVGPTSQMLSKMVR